MKVGFEDAEVGFFKERKGPYNTIPLLWIIFVTRYPNPHEFLCLLQLLVQILLFYDFIQTVYYIFRENPK